MRTIVVLLFLAISINGLTQSISVATRPTDVDLDPQRLRRIDNLLQDYFTQKKIPGAVALIVRNGKVAYLQAAGVRDVTSGQKLHTDDIFRIASQTKAVTSLAIMMLFEEGKFLLDEPVSNFIPEFANAKVLSSFNPTDTTYTTIDASRPITIRHLLTHTSGIDYPAIGSAEFRAIYAKAGIPSGIGNEQATLADKIRTLAKLPLKHHPGERFTYGLNTDVLGYLVEVLSGMSLDEFFRTRIFEPLGMKDTYFYVPRDKRSRVVALHEISNNNLVRVDHPVYDGVDPNYPISDGTYYSGGAGLSSTVEDYARFLQLFLNQGTYNNTRLLSRKTVELMLTLQTQEPITNQVGLGFGLETENNDFQSIVSKGTFSWGGAFSSTYWADPQEKLIGLLFTNMYNTPYGDIHEKFKTLVYQAIND
ncbi:MAG: beta-lactamase family protein [Cyclobacteriaceae bacterium]|jgi:CubicO group peptidase (beta-lactamase class C family)|nr:beta-lactamase family protein [Cyclobacteriaceae bacterium]